MEKIWGRQNGGSLGLGRKSLGSNRDTETWSWFWFSIPKRGYQDTDTEYWYFSFFRDTYSVFFRLNTDTEH